MLITSIAYVSNIVLYLQSRPHSLYQYQRTGTLMDATSYSVLVRHFLVDFYNFCACAKRIKYPTIYLLTVLMTS